MPALIIGANLPDVDAACFFWLEGTEHLGFRRGITHGPPALVILPLILAGILWYYDRWQTKRGKRPEDRLPVHFGWLYGLSFLGALSHPLLDWMNIYGVRFWEPFAPTWAYGNTLFIVDVWLWALLIISVWWGYVREKSGGNQRWIARGSIAIMLAYIGVNFMISRGYEVGESDVSVPGRVVIASPMPIFSWEREMIIGQSGRYTIIDPAIEGKDPADEHVHERHIQRVGECALEPAFAVREGNSQLDAFLFWSRTPFAQKANDGSMILYDARFFDPRASDRFSLALPDVQCEELGDQ